ncbi:uncharacterized protein B0I36DRAFT_344503 [Microdochium trichocladiopsis]|uniref:Cytochrome oxidase c assembly-domain-containing protein n=1 Tax=Microdochium trichocladiopsis TaxID=1682393 RepID=A0A9P9BUB6_9PEZI|nr:uncharacterized protein B0I36DRAFT_344503 [Microdochium trichocladiopsis]KAH7040826.1 hypothetical protein B0I36DRAFT_344503 [Microdochium trichocladiopsis]
MAADKTPRTVADATRFTSNTPHANTKSSPSSTAAASSKPPSSRLPPPGMPKTAVPESLDERVRRLRAAHLAARQAEVSKLDKVINSSRRYFDAAHRFTVVSLIAFSGVALMVTVYATFDMMYYNRQRRNEFFALQKQFADDSLEAARLAYMTGKATEEQIALVEEATAKARESGTELPALLSAPKQAKSAGWAKVMSPREEGGDIETAERSVWPGESMTESSLSARSEVEQPTKKGWSAWLFEGLKKEEVRDDDLTSASSDPRSTSASRTISSAQHSIVDSAKAAFETEKENQRHGGPLDRVGTTDTNTGSTKKGWLW